MLKLVCWKLCRHLTRKAQSDVLDVALFLQGQLNQHGMVHGYKLKHLKCIQSGVKVTQRTVQHLLKILDPQGVQLRKSMPVHKIRTKLVMVYFIILNFILQLQDPYCKIFSNNYEIRFFFNSVNTVHFCSFKETNKKMQSHFYFQICRVWHAFVELQNNEHASVNKITRSTIFGPDNLIFHYFIHT